MSDIDVYRVEIVLKSGRISRYCFGKAFERSKFLAELNKQLDNGSPYIILDKCEYAQFSRVGNMHTQSSIVPLSSIYYIDIVKYIPKDRRKSSDE